MNSLSWFLYIADVMPSLSTMFCGVGALLTIAGVVTIFIWWMCYADGDTKIKPPRILYWTASIFFLMFVGSFLIPSKETIYMIAGSEAGEYAVQSEQGQAIINDIQQVIEHQLSNLKGE